MAGARGKASGGWRFAVFLLALWLLVASGCGTGSPRPRSTPTSSSSSSANLVVPTATPGTVILKTATVGRLGTVLQDGSGKTLYHFTSDTPTASSCTGRCTDYWFPLITRGEPQAGSGVDAAKLGTFIRADGSVQVTYHGLSLYRFYTDSASNDAKGQGVEAFGGKWWVVSADGEVVEKSNLQQ